MNDNYQIFMSKIDPDWGAWYFFEKHFLLTYNEDVLFKPYDYQQRLLLDYKKYDKIMVSLSRQKGITITTIHFLIWKASFYTTRIAIILPNTFIKNMTKQMILNAHDNYHGTLPSIMEKYYTNVFHFNNNSFIYLISDHDHIRGMNLDLIWVDNFDLYQNQNSFKITELIPIALMSSKNPQIIVTGTDNNKSNYFNNLYDYHKVNYPL